MNRRDFLRAGVAAAGAGRLPGQSRSGDGWRTFEVTTRVEVLKPSGTTRVWVPAALTMATPYQKALANTFQCDGGAAKAVESNADAMEIVSAEFPAGVRPLLTVVSRVMTKDWAVDFSRPGAAGAPCSAVCAGAKPLPYL